MREYREADLQLCTTPANCTEYESAFVRTHRVDRMADGSLLIFGGIHYLSPAPPVAKSERQVAGSPGGGVRLFQVLLRPSGSGWTVVSVGVTQAS